MRADCLPGAAVTVRVNCQPLAEYATENGDLTATTFIEAIPGAEFDIALNLSHGFAYRDPADRLGSWSPLMGNTSNVLSSLCTSFVSVRILWKAQKKHITA